MDVACSVCGRVADPQADGDPPLSWATERADDGRVRHICDRCTRDNVRAIEAKLPQEWW